MDMSQPFEVPSGRAARGRVTAPPSKSHAIRALVCAALADGTSTLHGLTRCDADDVQRTIVALRTLGFTIDGDRVTGAGGRIPNPEVTLDLGGSATAIRFLAAMVALGPGPTTLTGDASLRGRPMLSTIRSVAFLGAHARSAAADRKPAPPLVVTRTADLRSQAAMDVSAADSSQSLSAALLVGPAVQGGIEVHALGAIASRPYVDLTLWTLQQFGVVVASTPAPERSTFCRAPNGHRVAEIEIVGDWSSAAFVLAAAAHIGGDAEITGLEFDSPQADRRIVDLLRDFGANVDRTPTGIRVRGNDRRPLDVDLRDAPDLAPLVGALGCVASGTTRVRGAAHLRLKESDRIATVVAAARALGCEAAELPDGFEIGGPAKHGGLVETKHDHRIAMAFAVAGLAIPGVVIDDPACVAKSYPGFWDDLARLIGA